MTLKRTELKRGTKPLARKTPIQRKAVISPAPVQQQRQRSASGLQVTGAAKAAPCKKPKKPTAKQYKLWCDTLFSLIVRSRGVCAKCGSTFNLQCSHRVSRSYLATRWDEGNADCCCKPCHFLQHQKPLENEAWLASVGVDLLALKRVALTHQKPDYPATLARLVKRAEALELDIDLEKYRKWIT